MQPAVLIRLRPLGPWRYGPGDGGGDRVDALYRSDRLYSAVTLAMGQLGWMEEWLEATARGSSPAVTFSSLFPFQGDTLFAPPPATLWPPPTAQVTTTSPVFLSKMRWDAARFVPLAVIESILNGQSILADQWAPDAESGCLLRRDRPSASPFRTVTRSAAAVDRVTGAMVDPHTCVGVEFEAGSGLWAVARFLDGAADAAWNERVLGAFRLLADSGFGGRRSSGWGHAAEPEVRQGAWPALLMPKLGRTRNGNSAKSEEAMNALYWLLSVYSPAAADAVDWSSGEYRIALRGGRVESNGGAGRRKKTVRMVVEGSVLAAGQEPAGAVLDVAPEGWAHAVYRSGFALALRLPEASPIAEGAAFEGPVESPTEEEALEERPCAEAHATAPQVQASAPEAEQENAPEQESATEQEDATEGESAPMPEAAPEAEQREAAPEEQGDEL